MQLLRARIQDGFLELKPEFPEDLWELMILIKPGDLVYSITTRKQSPSKDKLRPQELERIPITLGIRVEHVEFDGFGKRLRIRGRIVQGRDLGHYHTINLYQQPISIHKEHWREYELKMVSKLKRKIPLILGITLDEYDAEGAYLRGYMIEPLFQIQKLGKDRSEFFEKIRAKISKLDFQKLILAGPGFTKQDFSQYLLERSPQYSTKLILEELSCTGIPGFRELIRSGAVTRAGMKFRLELQIRAMERLLEELSKNGRAAIGLDNVKTCLELGCIEKILILEKMLSHPELDELMGEMDPDQLMILSSQHEWGEQLEALGGIAALLRFNPEGSQQLQR